MLDLTPIKLLDYCTVIGACVVIVLAKLSICIYRFPVC